MSVIKTSPKQINPKLIQHFVENKYAMKVVAEPVLMTGGTVNAGWQIATRESKFVLKVFTVPLEDNRSIQEELEIYRTLLASKINAPQVLPSLDGDFTKISIEGIQYPTVLMKLENLRRVNPANISDAEIKIIADTIAMMHKALKKHDTQLQSKEVVIPKGPNTPGNPAVDLHSPNGADLSMPQINKLTLLDKELVKHINTRYKRGMPLKTSVLHGDLSLGHIQFLDNGSTYIFDFSDYTYGPLIWDLATLLVYFYKEGKVNFSKWIRICRKFLFFYTQTIKLGTEDIDMIVPFVADRLLFEIRTLNRLSRKENRTVDREGNSHRYELAQYILDGSALLQ